MALESSGFAVRKDVAFANAEERVTARRSFVMVIGAEARISRMKLPCADCADPMLINRDSWLLGFSVGTARGEALQRQSQFEGNLEVRYTSTRLLSTRERRNS